MAALPIIKYLNVFEDVLDRLAPRPVLPLVDELALQGPKEALHTGVIPAVPFAAHAGDEAVRIKQTLIAGSGILTAAVRVVQEPCRGSSVRQRHREGLLGQSNS